MSEIARKGMHLSQEEIIAYAKTRATVIVQTEGMRISFAARIEQRDGERVVVIDDAEEHDYAMLRGVHETVVSASEQRERAELAEQLVGFLRVALRPSTEKPVPPWERFETTQPATPNEGGPHGQG